MATRREPASVIQFLAEVGRPSAVERLLSEQLSARATREPSPDAATCEPLIRTSPDTATREPSPEHEAIAAEAASREPYPDAVVDVAHLLNNLTHQQRQLRWALQMQTTLARYAYMLNQFLV